jgi:hypothetical protein
MWFALGPLAFTFFFEWGFVYFTTLSAERL